MGYIESLDEHTDKLQQIYAERNCLAVALALMTLRAGGMAGRGTDPEQMDERWSHVVYIDLPDGRQVSYHIAPDQVHLLDNLPVYEGRWDGTFVGREHAWAEF